MPAPIGNSNATKWTYAETEKIITKIELLAEKENMLYLGQALLAAGIYKGLWPRWKRKWLALDGDLYDRMRLIEQRFEVRLLMAGCYGRIPPGLCMLALRQNFGWTEI